MKKVDKELIKLFLNFVEGRITVMEFWGIYKNSNDLQTAFITDNKRTSIEKQLGFVPRNYIIDELDISLFSDRIRLFDLISAYLIRRKISFISKNSDDLEYKFFLEILPSYVNPLISNIDYLHQILLQAPGCLNKEDFKLWAKQKMKSLFVYETVPPDWIQDSEWPIIENIPLIFKQQKETEEGITQYIFYYPKNGEEMIIEQFE